MKNIEQHLEAIRKANEHAEAKHPFFANGIVSGDMKLRELSNKLKLCKNQNDLNERYGFNVYALEIITEEVFEAIEAFLKKDYQQAYDEFAQAAQVIVRAMDMLKSEYV